MKVTKNEDVVKEKVRKKLKKIFLSFLFKCEYKFFVNANRNFFELNDS